MKFCKNFGLIHLFLLIVITFFCCCDTPIDKYKPKNRDEQEILSVLIQYQNAKNNFDLDQLLLHDNGRFSFQCGLMISKEKLKELLPGYWAEIKSGNSAVIPIVHECINGDCYKSGKLNNPQINISNNKAEVTVVFTKGFSRVFQYFSMV